MATIQFNGQTYSSPRLLKSEWIKTFLQYGREVKNPPFKFKQALDFIMTGKVTDLEILETLDFLLIDSDLFLEFYPYIYRLPRTPRFWKAFKQTHLLSEENKKRVYVQLSPFDPELPILISTKDVEGPGFITHRLHRGKNVFRFAGVVFLCDIENGYLRYGIVKSPNVINYQIATVKNHRIENLEYDYPDRLPKFKMIFLSSPGFAEPVEIAENEIDPAVIIEIRSIRYYSYKIPDNHTEFAITIAKGPMVGPYHRTVTGKRFETTSMVPVTEYPYVATGYWTEPTTNIYNPKYEFYNYTVQRRNTHNYIPSGMKKWVMDRHGGGWEDDYVPLKSGELDEDYDPYENRLAHRRSSKHK